MRATVFLIIALLAIAALAASEHQRPNAGLPLIHASSPRTVLFAPCPLAPRNLPIFGGRNA